MSLPSPLLTVPTLTSDQISFQGLTMGNGTVFGLTQLEGLAKPQVRSGNTDRPRSRGAFIGLNLLKTRTITVTMDIGPLGANFGGYGNLATALAALRAAVSTEGSTEYPLWMQLPNFPLVCCMARVIAADTKYDYTAERGLLRAVPIQFEATDPYLYAAPTLHPSVGLGGVSGGFTFPITFPLSFGGAATPNQISAVNSGDVSCWPVLVITGPCLNPSVSNLSVAGNPTVSLNIALNTGDVLVIDCDMQSVLFTAAGQTVAAPYPQILQSGSTFFSLPAATTSLIAFDSQDVTSVAGTLSLWYASAYDGLVG